MRYILKDLSVDPEARAVWRDGVTIKLPDLSFDVLVTLLTASPKPVSNVELCREVWRVEHVSDETVAQRIALLRKALRDSIKEPTYIRTVRGAGYAIAGPIVLQDDETLPNAASFLNRHRKIAASIALVALVFTAALASSFWGEGAKSELTPEDTNQKSAVAIQIERAREQLGLHQSRETDRAIAMLRDVLTGHPNSFDARLTLSFALSTKATKFGGGVSDKREAETIARDLISERPDSSNAWS
ncbi:MAG: winged helix-turn-helix domain-containing protein, partial [Kordiimonadaceae bacterium]|nr:winged helix-turn-helix domain-containing protein [Kordiimonadaceae bacterium]